MFFLPSLSPSSFLFSLLALPLHPPSMSPGGAPPKNRLAARSYRRVQFGLRRVEEVGK